MRTVSLLGAASLVIAAVGVAVGSAWAQSPRVSGFSQETTAPAAQGRPQDGPAESHPLFSVGKLEVHIWAPMEPYYDATMNRNAAANPIWGEAE
ncbi:hypothetical protein [Rhodopila sp.]|uniref:hypothetical protein n=1 Tax=Rhodopila sp. TaxID=2480087 RepID=UPI003D0F5246